MIDISVMKPIYEAINKRDWVVFCSYMSDYDHPEERVGAEERFNSFKSSYSIHLQGVIDEVANFMKSDNDYNIHKMEDEVKE